MSTIDVGTTECLNHNRRLNIQYRYDIQLISEMQEESTGQYINLRQLRFLSITE